MSKQFVWHHFGPPIPVEDADMHLPATPYLLEAYEEAFMGKRGVCRKLAGRLATEGYLLPENGSSLSVARVRFVPRSAQLQEARGERPIAYAKAPPHFHNHELQLYTQAGTADVHAVRVGRITNGHRPPEQWQGLDFSDGLTYFTHNGLEVHEPLPTPEILKDLYNITSAANKKFLPL